MKCKRCGSQMEYNDVANGYDFYFTCPKCERKLNKIIVFIILLCLGGCWIWFFIG